MWSYKIWRVLSKNKDVTKLPSCSVNFSTQTESSSKKNSNSNYAHQLKMKAWHIHAYGGIQEVQFSERHRVPFISHPKDVLVKVHTSSVNPLDVAMLDGYGSTLLNMMRCSEIEFPLCLGRDFCGSVVEVGQQVKRNIKPGSLVWGVVPVHKQGCHAEYVLVSDDCVGPKPSNISNIEATSIPYAGLTAWNALYGCSGINCGLGARGKKVLVLGAAGGVGSLAVQMLKAEGIQVIAVCSTDACKNVEELGAHTVLDYTSPDFALEVVHTGPYDIIFDCAGIGSQGADKYPWNYSTYITLTTPMLRNTDKSGLLGGMLQNVVNFVEPNIKSVSSGKGPVQWAFFRPSEEGLNYLSRLVCKGQLKPNVESVYSFDETPCAYIRVQEGHMRGKIVIEMTSNC